MHLYLVRHGEALPREEEPEQGLSKRGRQNVRRVGSFLGRAGVQVEAVLESGKKRATQTAQLLAPAVAGGRFPVQSGGLDPVDPVAPVVEKIASWKVDSMIVGHLPFLSRLASALLLGKEEPDVVRFPPAGVACLARDENRRWVLLWMVTPEIL